MVGQVTLTPTESKKLTAKAIARMDVVKQAAAKGMVVLHPSSSTYFVVEEITGSKPKTNVWVCGVIAPKGACVEMGMAMGFQFDTSAATHDPGDFHHSWVIRNGEVSVGEKLSGLLEQMGSEDVYLKGVNALDPQGNVGVLVGNPIEGGTIGRVLSAWRKKGFNLIFPVGLEKLIPLSVDHACKEAARSGCDYAMGIAVGLFPITEGQVLTEVDAIRILSGATAIPIAAGGLGGAEGAVVLVIKGTDE